MPSFAPSSSSHISLVLSGGGSRAAYQAGALKAIVEILGPRSEATPFASICGISAGAINAAFLASHADDFRAGVLAVGGMWRDLRSNQILKDDFFTMSLSALRWMRDLTFGGLVRGARANHLLNSIPLEKFLKKRINFEAIHDHVESGRLKGVVITATDLRSGMAISFFDAAKEVIEWQRSARRGKRAKIELAHVLASASIPILFRPVPVGGCYFGDGSVSLRAPLSPAIHLGAEKILAIGIRHPAPAPSTTEGGKAHGLDPINLVDIAGVMLNAALMESFEADVERLERINRAFKAFEKKEEFSALTQLRPIPILSIQPSKDLGSFAADQFHHFPRMLRHFLKGLGASDEKGWDLLSYLSFDTSYTTPLMELGYQDALEKRDEILEFFEPSSTVTARS